MDAGGCWEDSHGGGSLIRRLNYFLDHFLQHTAYRMFTDGHCHSEQIGFFHGFSFRYLVKKSARSGGGE